MTPVSTKFRGEVRQWLLDAPDVEMDPIDDSFRASADAWLNEWSRVAQYDDDSERLLIWLTRYQLALINAKEPEVSLGNDRLSQAFWAMIVAVVGAGIVATAPASASALVSAATFVAIASGIVAVGHACYSIWKNARKARRHRMIQAIYDRVERIVQSIV